MRRTFVLTICWFFLIYSYGAFAQDTLFNARKHKIGFVAGTGFQYLGQFLGSDNRDFGLKTLYHYQVTFYQLQYYMSVLRKRNFGMDILAQPQYNITRYRPRDADNFYERGSELGLNIGLLLRQNFSNDRFSLYVAISSGPHYTTGTPQRQVKGFIFSDSMFCGMNIRLYKNLYGDLRTGFRHISNAGYKRPNGGLNDIILNQGVFVAF